MKTSQILKALPLVLFVLALLPFNASSKTLLFRQAVDTEFPIGPQGHLMDLKGAWSLAASGSSDIGLEAKGYMANAVIPFSSNPDSILHGYFVSPTYFTSEGNDIEHVKTLGMKGWQLTLGRANLNFPRSTFRGYLMAGYRKASLNNDSNTENNKNSFALQSHEEEKSAIVISTGVSSTQTSLVSQKRPLIDTELLLNLRYEYEKGDLFTHVKAAAFYPTWLDLGANIAWYKVYRESENPLYNEVSDDFVFGPRVRGRAWDQLAFDTTLEWHAHRDFNGGISVSSPRAIFSLIANF